VSNSLPHRCHQGTDVRIYNIGIAPVEPPEASRRGVAP
jgi:hypothetical protein